MTKSQIADIKAKLLATYSDIFHAGDGLKPLSPPIDISLIERDV